MKTNLYQHNNNNLNITTELFIKKNLPKDFDINIYKLLNTDLINLSSNDLKLHYIYNGKLENRLYKLGLPLDFCPILYKKFNKDLININDEIELKKHYLISGALENRVYKKYNKNYDLIENNIDIKNFYENTNIKISIVMAYYKRIGQLKLSLNQFKFLYENKYNFEVIIVDDFSNEDEKLKFLINKYSFEIKLIKIIKKNWINPCIPYNIGFSLCKGDIIIIQNPEIFHCDDIIKIAINKIYNEKKTYITFPVYGSPSFKYNKIIKELQKKQKNNKKINYYKKFIKNINYKKFKFDYEYYKNKYKLYGLTNKELYEHWINIGIKNKYKCNKYSIYYVDNIINKWKGWYNHIIYNNRDLHFLAAFDRTLFDKIGGFCNDFKDGMWYEDDDFKFRISKITNIETINSKKFMGIHLYHKNSSINDIFNNDIDIKNINKEIFKKNIINNIIYCDINLENINYLVMNNN
jgi:hypothetical protein